MDTPSLPQFTGCDTLLALSLPALQNVRLQIDGPTGILSSPLKLSPGAKLLPTFGLSWYSVNTIQLH
jgi:hypothetical protein